MQMSPSLDFSSHHLHTSSLSLFARLWSTNTWPLFSRFDFRLTFASPWILILPPGLVEKELEPRCFCTPKRYFPLKTWVSEFQRSKWMDHNGKMIGLFRLSRWSNIMLEALIIDLLSYRWLLTIFSPFVYMTVFGSIYIYILYIYIWIHFFYIPPLHVKKIIRLPWTWHQELDSIESIFRLKLGLHEANQEEVHKLGPWILGDMAIHGYTWIIMDLVHL